MEPIKPISRINNGGISKYRPNTSKKDTKFKEELKKVIKEKEQENER